MTRVRWICLVLLYLAVTYSDARGGRGGRRGGGGGGGGGWWNWNIYFIVLGAVTLFVLVISCAKARENHDGSRCKLGIPQVKALTGQSNYWTIKAT